MNETNPYSAPTSSIVEQDSEQLELATRGERFGGALVDGIISVIISIPLMFATGYMQRALQNQITFVDTLLAAAAGIGIFLVLNGYLLSKYGQTIGKRVVGTRIVSIHNDRILPLWKVFGLRYIIPQLFAMIPFIGSIAAIINVLFIFRSDKRCIHDHIAGTKVVKAA